jgi:hypothetical protein
MTQRQAFDRAVRQFPGFEVSSSTNMRTSHNNSMTIMAIDYESGSFIGLGLNWEDAYFSLLSDYRNRSCGK